MPASSPGAEIQESGVEICVGFSSLSSKSAAVALAKVSFGGAQSQNARGLLS